MKLDPTYVITNYQSLRNEVARDDEYSPTTSDKLQMTEKQYIAYKELVFGAVGRGVSETDNPIMRFDGLEIVVHTPPLAK